MFRVIMFSGIPLELAYLHDWNVILVPEGLDFEQILIAQRTALRMRNSQPTAIVYRTKKGWQYGVEGKASHGAGHGLCTDGFYQALNPMIGLMGGTLPRCEGGEQRCRAGQDKAILEECFWEALQIIRSALEKNRPIVNALAQRLVHARTRLNRRSRKPRPHAPVIESLFETAKRTEGSIPSELTLQAGKSTTLRGELGRVLNHYNKASNGAILTAAADLLGSTSVNTAAQGFPRRILQCGYQPGGPASLHRRHLRGCYVRYSGRPFHVRTPSGRWFLLQRLYRPAGSHRQPPARDRQSGPSGHCPGALPPDDSGLRPCRA